MIKNLKVSEFRDLTSASFDCLKDFQTCLNDVERVAWFQRAFVWISKLSNAECKTAKERDIAKKDRLIDQFGQMSSDNFDLWRIAMKKTSSQFFSTN